MNVTLDAVLHRALELQTEGTKASVSDLVDRAVRDALSEDQKDSAEFDERCGESTVSFEEVVKRLDLDSEL